MNNIIKLKNITPNHKKIKLYYYIMDKLSNKCGKLWDK